MSRAPLMTTSHGFAPRPETLVPLATCAWMTLLVVAVAGVIDGSPYVPGRKKNWRRWLPDGALRAALIEATDIDGSKIVTFAPNGFDATVATGVGAVVHGGLAAADAEETPPRRTTMTTDTTPSSLRIGLSSSGDQAATPIAPLACAIGPFSGTGGKSLFAIAVIHAADGRAGRQLTPRPRAPVPAARRERRRWPLSGATTSFRRTSGGRCPSRRSGARPRRPAAP